METDRFPDLDETDILLVSELESDARQTYQDLAAKLGINRLTVANKMKHLLDNDIIRVVCWPDPLALGYEFSVYLAIDAQPSQINNVTQSLATCPQIMSVWLCTGRFNVGAFALFREHRELAAFISDQLGPIEGISRLETLGLIEVTKAMTKLLSDETEFPSPKSPIRNVDELDLRLIGELQDDARQRAGPLSKKLGVTESTILRRIQRLVDERVIRIRAGIHPWAIGYEGSAYLGIKCHPAKVGEVADAIASHKQVGYVTICVGRYDIFAFVWFKKMNDLRRFLTVELGNIPGLKDIETSLTSRFVKYFDRIPV